eukprot:TRINITY_DN14887_c0_g2_i11.p2 TRINITY_DN14887_c0_g2~~TRINITY_DN14887_c0_g2_i11.p2  ORF type:complete len:192 (-),score=36.95 TRINITY_DN14887_c0_g2_i11:202-777(-)
MSKAGKGPEETKGKGPDNEIRVKSATYTRTYLAYIARLFQENQDTVIIRGTGYAIPKAVGLAMLVRRRFKGLHQIVKIDTNEFSDRDFSRKVGLIAITLSKKQLDENDVGYSPPLPDSEVTEYQPYVPGEAPAGGADRPPRREFRGAPRGRGYSGFRGGRRGGYRAPGYDAPRGRFGGRFGGRRPTRGRNY